MIQWIAFLGRLSTGDRLAIWGVTTDTSCVLCSNGRESHDHLFFECSYSSVVWSALVSKNGVIRIPLGLNAETDRALKWCSRFSSQAPLLKLSFVATIYYIWV